ncbi:hypothetical protein CDEN61S_03648 [Castellaniella denitrificans]
MRQAFQTSLSSMPVLIIAALVVVYIGTASTELYESLIHPLSGSFAFTGTGQLLQPLFDAGRNQANLEVSEGDTARSHWSVRSTNGRSMLSALPRGLSGRARRPRDVRRATARATGAGPCRGYSLPALRPALSQRRSELPRSAGRAALAVRRAAGGRAGAGGPGAEPRDLVPRARRRLEGAGAAVMRSALACCRSVAPRACRTMTHRARRAACPIPAAR